MCRGNSVCSANSHYIFISAGSEEGCLASCGQLPTHRDYTHSRCLATNPHSAKLRTYGRAQAACRQMHAHSLTCNKGYAQMSRTQACTHTHTKCLTTLHFYFFVNVFLSILAHKQQAVSFIKKKYFIAFGNYLMKEEN